jgi:hypothetical protein
MSAAVNRRGTAFYLALCFGETITNDCSVGHNLVRPKEAHPGLLTDPGMR